jgi:CO/xanthine dehydrogenase FAD-binding subunit
MDLIHVNSVVRPRAEAALPGWAEGDAFVGGGTWLFSDPQPQVRRLVDLSALNWIPIIETPSEIIIAANCTYRWLEAHDWPGLPAGRIFATAIRSLSSSFKTYGLATVGGNIGLAFAKGMMTPVFITLDATYELATAASTGSAASTRLVPAAAFQTGVCKTILRPGEYVRSIHVPRVAFARRLVLRRAAHSATSHVTAMVIGATDPGTGATTLTLSGALAYPVRFTVNASASPSAQVDAICAAHPLIADSHGSQAYRQLLLRELATEALAALATPDHAA